MFQKVLISVEKFTDQNVYRLLKDHKNFLNEKKLSILA